MALVAFMLAFGAAGTAFADKPCVLTEIKDAKAAALKVYFTKFLKEDNTNGRYKNCRISKAGGEAFFVTPFRQDATVVVHKSNWPPG